MSEEQEKTEQTDEQREAEEHGRQPDDNPPNVAEAAAGGAPEPTDNEDEGE